jgi:hypothetical protein
MAEVKRGYMVSTWARGTVLVALDCIVTPKRIAVYHLREDGTRLGTVNHYGPNQTKFAWTPEEAWTRFLQQRQQKRQELQKALQTTEAEIAAAEQALSLPLPQPERFDELMGFVLGPRPEEDSREQYDRWLAAHRAADPHCSCNDCQQWEIDHQEP